MLTRRAFSGLLGAGLSGLGAPRALAAPPPALVEAARREGKVVVYSAYLSPTTHGRIGAAFEKAYGIKVDYLTARGAELRERTRIEQSAGRFLGDVLHTASSNIFMSIEIDKTLDPHGGLPGSSRLKPDFASRADGMQAPIFTINYGFLVNTSLVKPGDEPKTWQDLLDPKWKGKILFDDPRTSGGGRVMFHMTMDKFGRAYHEKLAAQQPVFSRDYGEAGRRVARGEFAIYVPLILSEYMRLKGLPVKMIIPEEGVTYGSYSVSVLRNAPHPNAARLLCDYYLSDDAQEIYADTGHGITISDLKAKLAPEVALLADVKPLVAEDFTRIDSYLQLAKEIYG